jgi:hypothetical protein
LPSSSITRTSRARICRFILVFLSMARGVSS